MLVLPSNSSHEDIFSKDGCSSNNIMELHRNRNSVNGNNEISIKATLNILQQARGGAWLV